MTPLRNRPSLGGIYPDYPLAPLVDDDPFSPHFCPSVKGDKPKDLLTYLLFLQNKTYGETILKTIPNMVILKAHFKLLLKTYKPEMIKRGIKLASLRCNHPFSIRWIKMCCEELDV